MSAHLEIKSNLNAQLFELEALQSVYPDELLPPDHGVLTDISDFVNDKSEKIPHRMEYSIELKTPQESLEILISLPLEYPSVDPEIYCRSAQLARTEQTNFNKSILSFMSSQEKGEPFIYTIISWIQDHSELYFKNSQENDRKKPSKPKENDKNKDMEFVRYWIYSHHIYCKFKRKQIIDLTKDFNLTGFSLVGKPGVICVEGLLDDCESFWQEIKAMNWQRIFVKFLEKDFTNHSDLNRKFNDFQEISFPTSERHNDMTQFIKYLTEHELQYAFKELFGVEAKVGTQAND